MKKKTNAKNDKNSRNRNIVSHEEERGILFYLKAIFTWKTITGIISIITIGYFVYDRYFAMKEIDVMKERILKNITIIEDKSNPELLPSEVDSLKDVKLIKDFMIASVELCTLWKSIESSESYSYHYNHDESQAHIVLLSNLDREKQCDQLMLRIEQLLDSIYNYGIDNNIGEYTRINASKTIKFKTLMHQKADIILTSYQEFVQLLDLQKEKEAYKLMDKRRNDIKYYELDDAFFDFLVDTSNIFDIRLRKYKKISYERSADSL